MGFLVELGLAHGAAEVEGHALVRVGAVFDGAERGLVPADVLLQGGDEAHGVLGCHDDAAFDAGLGQAGHHPDEVQHELGVRVGDHGEVAVMPLGYIVGEFEIELVLLLLLHFHKNVQR